MNFINIKEIQDQELLSLYNIPLSKYESILSTAKLANSNYYDFSQKNKHFHKMLNARDIMMREYTAPSKMPVKEKNEWLKIRDKKTGDRSYVYRMLMTILKKSGPQLNSLTIDQHLSAKAEWLKTGVPELSDEIDALLLGTSIPNYFEYLEKLGEYKTGVFSPLRRSYIQYIQLKSINIISQFLKTFAQDLTVMENSLFCDRNLQALSVMGEIVSKICDQADPNHHDPLNIHTINSLRTCYVSIFNAAMLRLREKGEVPLEVKQFLPIIPDKLDFSKNQLDYDNAWSLYQNHHFLFMRMPKEEKTKLGECLQKLSSIQRVSWMGCLGKEEIRALVLPMISQRSRFENLIKACQDIPQSDNENYPFGSRVLEVLNAIYNERLLNNETTPNEIHQLLNPKGITDTTGPTKNQPPDTQKPAVQTEEIELSVIRTLSYLVVDDSERIRQMTIKVLKDAGVEQILEAGDGVEAWECLQNNKIDVVLCDWIMPKMTGIQLVQKVMQIESLALKISFLMLTTVNHKAAIVEALSIGVRGFLIKPFTRKQLLEKVYFATEWLRKEQESD